MQAGYVIALLLVSTGTALFKIGLAKVRTENEERVEQGWARRRAYYEIASSMQPS